MPSADYMRQIDAQFEVLDQLPPWQIELVWDYGVDRTLRVVREHPTPARARVALEADRQARQWSLANHVD
jgi:hypothetical protein